MKIIDLINWNKINNLIPAIVVSDENEILMHAYMSKEALEETIRSGYATYYSRTRKKLWKKGETSGNFQEVVSINLDCDNDAIILKVKQSGVACHTGNNSCFFNEFFFDDIEKKETPNIQKMEYNILDELYHEILDRKFNGDLEKSYVKKLISKGENSYLKKVSEECGEFILAVKDIKNSVGEHSDDTSYDVVYEACDLIFHMLIALADKDIHPERIFDELKRRRGISGITEKNERKK